MTLETWLKIYTNVYSFVSERPPKPYKIRHASTAWKELIRKSLCLPVQEYHRNREKKLRVYMVLGDVFTKLLYGSIFNHVSRVFPVQPQSTKRVQKTNLNMIFYMVVSVYR